MLEHVLPPGWCREKKPKRTQKKKKRVALKIQMVSILLYSINNIIQSEIPTSNHVRIVSVMQHSKTYHHDRRSLTRSLIDFTRSLTRHTHAPTHQNPPLFNRKHSVYLLLHSISCYLYKNCAYCYAFCILLSTPPTWEQFLAFVFATFHSFIH